jgi:hypothetical protein
VKNMLRLFRFFVLSFLGVFLMAAVLWGFSVCINGAQFIPPKPGNLLGETAAAARNAIPVGLYTALLFSLSYAVRRNIPVFLTLLILWTTALALTLGLFLGVGRLSALVPAGTGQQAPALGKPGLILSEGRTTVILIEDPGKARGVRAVSRPGRSLGYQASGGPEPLPMAPFYREGSPFLDKLRLEGALCADRLSLLFGEGLIPFLLYTGALIFLLVSLRFVLDLSGWPLANLLLGALIFRGVLSFEGFIGLQDVRALIRSFMGNRLPESLLSPLIFCGIGLLFIVYTWLVFLGRNRKAAAEGAS